MENSQNWCFGHNHWPILVKSDKNIFNLENSPKWSAIIILMGWSGKILHKIGKHLEGWRKRWIGCREGMNHLYPWGFVDSWLHPPRNLKYICVLYKTRMEFDGTHRHWHSLMINTIRHHPPSCRFCQLDNLPPILSYKCGNRMELRRWWVGQKLKRQLDTCDY